MRKKPIKSRKMKSRKMKSLKGGAMRAIGRRYALVCHGGTEFGDLETFTVPYNFTINFFVENGHAGTSTMETPLEMCTGYLRVVQTFTSGEECPNSYLITYPGENGGLYNCDNISMENLDPDNRMMMTYSGLLGNTYEAALNIGTLLSNLANAMCDRRWYTTLNCFFCRGNGASEYQPTVFDQRRYMDAWDGDNGWDGAGVGSGNDNEMNGLNHILENGNGYGNG